MAVVAGRGGVVVVMETDEATYSTSIRATEDDDG